MKKSFWETYKNFCNSEAAHRAKFTKTERRIYDVFMFGIMLFCGIIGFRIGKEYQKQLTIEQKQNEQLEERNYPFE